MKEMAPNASLAKFAAMRRGLVPGQQLGREAPTGQALGYFYFEEEPGRRSSDVRFKATAVIGCFSSKTARSRLTQAV
jgi:hypothetical protein